jgi:glycosyltransferase involved in cell wall biosynthesis
MMARVALRIFVIGPSIGPSGLLTDHLPHGDGLVAFGFVRELAARGHEVHVAAGSVDLRGELPPSAHLYPLGGEDAAARARLRFMRSLHRLYTRLAGSTTFDVIHQLNPVDVGVSLALADKDVPVVLGPYIPDWAPTGEGADLIVSPTAQKVKHVLRAVQQRCATAVLLSTPAAASKLEPRAGRRLNVQELSPGIDERAWLPARDRAQAQEVLFLANLEVRKGIHVALDAFFRLAPELPAARLVVGGVGPELEEVRRRVARSPAAERVELLGHVERDRVLQTMQSCDVYCLPSYGEPFGMTALEAMACAKPVVGTDAGGLRYLVPDKGGRKVPPGDAPALAEALREVVEDPALRRTMGEHNRKVVEERHAWSRVVDRLEDVYRKATREPRGGWGRSRRRKS